MLAAGVWHKTTSGAIWGAIQAPWEGYYSAVQRKRREWGVALPGLSLYVAIWCRCLTIPVHRVAAAVVHHVRVAK